MIVFPDTQREQRVELRFDHFEFSANSLRSRMQKRGWVVGNLYDGYTLNSIVKTFHVTT